jgi:polyisoprenoid-binding protein YceI
MLAAFAPATSFAQDKEKEGGGKVETLKVDAAHSKLMARADHVGIGFVFVEFPDLSGTIEFNPDEPAESSIDFTAKTTTLVSHQKKRDKHLKGPDFFNAKKHPELTFESKNIEKTGEDTYKVAGDLTIKGTTKSIEIQVKHIGSGKGPQGKFRRGFYTEFEINRLDFGIDWKPEASDEMVRIILAIESVRQ